MSEIIARYRNVEIERGDKVVLNNVSFDILKGQMYYLIGRVGSGKSSLLKSMYCDVPIENGQEARIMDFNLIGIKNSRIPYLRRRIGIVFQDFQLLTDRSVMGNLEFVLKATGWRSKREMGERIEEVLTDVGMANKSYKMPHELSGGEQQRIVIARALLNKPDLILADEPTGNLDPQTGHQIAELLHSIAMAGKTIVMATHNHQIVDEFPGILMECRDKQLFCGEQF